MWFPGPAIIAAAHRVILVSNFAPAISGWSATQVNSLSRQYPVVQSSGGILVSSRDHLLAEPISPASNADRNKRPRVPIGLLRYASA
jgi:hypothetical protein